MTGYCRSLATLAIVCVGTAATGVAQAQYPFGYNPYVYNPYVQQMNQANMYRSLEAQSMASQHYGSQGAFPASPGFNPLTAGSQASSMSNPYLPNPGLPNPYNPYNPYNPFNPFFPYSMGWGPGGVLFGQAEVMNAYGNVLNQQEQARVTREQALQAQIDTQRKRFDFEMYVRANTPTFSEEQAKIATQVLKRIQTNAPPSEITNGKALNVLLADLRQRDRKVHMAAEPISEEILHGLNVIRNGGNLGLLRNDGKFTWPVAFQEVLTDEGRERIELTAQAALQKAFKGQPENNLLIELRNLTNDARDKLTAQVNTIPTSQYLQAKRFLDELNEARIALERGEAETLQDYQAFIKGGKTIEQFTEYMITKGLKFAPATLRDEAPYRAIFSALVTFDVTVNARLVQNSPLPN